jgi:imidazolonepropionase
MTVLRNIGFLATCRYDGKQDVIHPIHDAAVAWEDGRISWVGPNDRLPQQYWNDEYEDAGGRLVIPGLIDCHTHLCFAGWRADEFVRKLSGESYLDIARQGGGIQNTVQKTRSARIDDLLGTAKQHLHAMLRLGITTVECKSGYGLNVDDEIKQLLVYRSLDDIQPIRLITTYLAHTVPPEYADTRTAYLNLVRENVIPRVASDGLALFCDVFVEDTAFTADEARQILATGSTHGLIPRVHADQLSNCRGAELAVEMGASSADHLEKISEDGIRRMVESDTVAVSLPLASLYLNVPPQPARRLIDAGIPVAVATDFNPGSAPSFHLPLAMLLGCTMQRMKPAEVLKGATIIAARALRQQSSIGSIEVGKSADLVVVDAPDVDHWMYHFRSNAVVTTVAGGLVYHTNLA